MSLFPRVLWFFPSRPIASRQIHISLVFEWATYLIWVSAIWAHIENININDKPHDIFSDHTLSPFYMPCLLRWDLQGRKRWAYPVHFSSPWQWLTYFTAIFSSHIRHEFSYYSVTSFGEYLSGNIYLSHSHLYRNPGPFLHCAFSPVLLTLNSCIVHWGHNYYSPRSLKGSGIKFIFTRLPLTLVFFFLGYFTQSNNLHAAIFLRPWLHNYVFRDSDRAGSVYV